MRRIYFAFILLAPLIGATQGFDKYEGYQLESIGIDLEDYDFKNPTVVQGLKSVLEKERKYDNAMTSVHTVGVLAVITTTLGLIMASPSNAKKSYIDLRKEGRIVTIVGLIQDVVVIPLYERARKKKKEREKAVLDFITFHGLSN